MTYDNKTANGGGMQNVAFLTTFLPTRTQGAPSLVDKDRNTFILDGETYYVRHKSDLDFVNAGEVIDVAWVLEGGRKYAISVDFADPDKNDRLQLQQGGGLFLGDNNPMNDGDFEFDGGGDDM